MSILIKNIIIKLLSIFFIILALVTMSVAPVNAEGLAMAIKYSDTSPTTGQTIVVTFAVAYPIDVSNYEATVSYDNSVFEYIDNSAENVASSLSTFDSNKIAVNQIKVAAFGGLHNGATNLYRLSFKALKAGQAIFQISGVEINSEYPASTQREITVTDPVPKSSDNSLKSLAVNPGLLSPAFTAAQLNYTVSVGADVTELLVSATTNNSKASVSGGGKVSLAIGDNTVKVVVTAENGEKKTYTITVSRAAPSPSPSPSPTPAVTISQPDGNYSIISPPEGTPIPGGFYSTLDTVGGQSVPAFRAIKGDLTLYYLQTESGTTGFYYLDSTSGEYLPFLTLSLPAIAFPILSPDSSAFIPGDFTKITYELDGIPVTAWQSVRLPAGQVLLYLMNNDGDKGFYIYDEANRLISLFAGNTSVSETTETTPSVTETTTQETGETPVTGSFGGWQLIAFLLGALCLILIGVMIWLITRGKNDDGLPPRHGKSPKIRRVD